MQGEREQDIRRRGDRTNGEMEAKIILFNRLNFGKKRITSFGWTKRSVPAIRKGKMENNTSLIA